MTENKDILVTGATGFIGRYIMEELQSSGYKPDTLARRGEVTYSCDLEKSVPDLSRRYDVVVHVAGTDEQARADELNNHGTARLLEALERAVPDQIIYISTVHVYGMNPGTEIREDCFLRPDTDYARSKIRAEKQIEKWCASRGVTCTILRPALTAGSGMHGRLARMADAIARGRYMHIGKNQGVRSLVTAVDVARAVRLTFGVPGVYNVTDGKSHTMIEIADAIALNLGKDKRILTLPAGLVKWGLRLLPLSGLRAAVQTLTASCTYSNSALCQSTGFKPFDTVEVMARREPDYPYKEK